MKAPVTPGYSGTPLAKKLGVTRDCRLLPIDAPPNYAALLAPLPANVRWVTKADDTVEVAHVFATRKSKLQEQLESLRKKLRADAAVWASWPKKSAKVATDITEDTIREIALPLGFVDIKVCAVSDVWSGLKLVVRKELR